MTPQLLEGILILHQGQKSAGNEIGRCFMSADERDDDVCDDLIGRERGAIHACRCERLNHAGRCMLLRAPQ